MKPMIGALLALVTLAGGAATTAVGGAAPSAAGGGRGTQPAAAVTLAPCQDLPQLPTAQCGTVAVPLDHRHPRAGTTEVAFAVVPRTDTSRPSLGAVAPNPGGPGLSTLETGHSYAAGLAPVLHRRELLLVDTRGVGRSEPVTCPALDGPARVFAGLEEQRALIGRCGEQLGDRVATYGSAAFADDLDAVRSALRIRKLDLLGDSYGTFLMPVYAQRHPRHVRSIVLSGAYAVNIDSNGAVGEQALRRAITLVGQRTGAYSGDAVIADLAALATRLRTTPEAMTVTYGGVTHQVSLDEWQLAGTVAAVYSSTPDTDAALALADAAAAARTGDLEPIRVMVRANLSRLGDAYSLGSAVVSDTAAWATTCHDYPTPFDLTDPVEERRADLDAHIAAQRPGDYGIFSAEAWLTRAGYDAGACLQWRGDRTAGTPFPPGARLPDVPVLVLSGDLDANTSSASGREAAAQFRRARWVEVAGAGHTPSSSAEGQRLIHDFITTPR